MSGDELIVWSARIVVAAYFVRLGIDLLGDDPGRRDRWSRYAWTAGCAVFLLHLAFAFHFLHGWSHGRAMAHTARRTAEVTGIDWAGGIYINYAFTVFWIADVAWWWARSLSNKPTPAVMFWTVHVVFAFMFFNATVVFGPPFWKWVVAAAFALLAALWFLLPRAPNLHEVRG